MKNLALFALLATGNTVMAQEPTLVTDYLQGKESSFTLYETIGIVNDNVNVFPLTTEDLGEELGTVQDGEVILLKDLFEGAESSSPSNFTFNNGKAYFSAEKSSSEIGIWESDGTANGTKMIVSVDSKPSHMIMSRSGNLYFVIDYTLYMLDGSDYVEIQQDVYLATDFKTRANNYCLYGDEIAFLANNENNYDLYTVESGKPKLITAIPAKVGISLAAIWGLNEIEAGFIFTRTMRNEPQMEGTYIYNTTTEALTKLKINNSQITAKGIQPLNQDKAIVWVQSDGYYAVNGIEGEEELIIENTKTPTWGYEFKAVSYNGYAVFTIDYGIMDGAFLVYTDGTAGGSKTLNELQPYSKNFVLSGSTAFFATGTSNGFSPEIIKIDMSAGTSESVYVADYDSGTDAIQLLGVQNDVMYFISNSDSDVGYELYSLNVSTNSGTKDPDVKDPDEKDPIITDKEPNNNNTTVYTADNSASHVVALPNPSHNSTTLQFGELLTNIEVTVLSNTGAIQQVAHISQAQQLSLSIDGPTGVYYITIKSDSKTEYLTVMKQ